jgi:hypothetical protein
MPIDCATQRTKTIAYGLPNAPTGSDRDGLRFKQIPSPGTTLWLTRPPWLLLAALLFVREDPFRECPLLARSGHRLVHCTCLLLTQSGHCPTAQLPLFQCGLSRYDQHWRSYDFPNGPCTGQPVFNHSGAWHVGPRVFRSATPREGEDQCRALWASRARLRSAVSAPSSNQRQTGSSSARASSSLPCVRQSSARLVAARNSKDLAF